MENEIIKIVFLIDTIDCDTAGTQKQLLEIAKRLNKKLIEPHIICLYSSPWMDNKVFPCRVTVLGYQGFLKLNFLSIVLKLRQVIREEHVHILQTFFEDSIFVAFFASLGLGKNGCILLSSRRDMGLGKNRPWYHRLYSFLLPYVNKRFDGIVCNSYEVKMWVANQERVPLGNIRVIHNGTSFPTFTGPVPELFLQTQPHLWFGLVASLTPIKRIDVFIRALRIMLDVRPDISFRAVVLGEGPEREKLISLVQDCQIEPLIHFCGSVNNVSDYLSRIDVGVLCSDREGLSNAVLEYMAHALPVIVTAVGGNTELVNCNNGFCVPAGDEASLADSLILLADNPALRKKLGQAGREKVKLNYSWDRSINELEGYYSQLVAAKDAFW